ncbi:MAG: ATP-binding protein [Dehalococcoidales bacterium]|nr:ATP-binding protein [Dehalococcoidales bacterium]
MEHISDILKKQTRTGTSRESTDISSNADEASPGRADCPVCRGAGIVHPCLTGGEPDYSRVISCDCVQRETGPERGLRLLRYSNLGALSRFTFDNLESQGRSGHPRSREQFAAAYLAARDFADMPQGWLVFSGPSGSGKTHLAAAIVNERTRQGFPALYITVPDLLDKLRAAYSPDSEAPFDESLDSLKNALLLVLDDLGVQSATAWAKEKLDQLLNSRFNNELPTVIVTVTPFEQLDDRLRTRLTDPRLCRTFILEEEYLLTEYGWGTEFELQKTQMFANFDRRTELSAEEQENLDWALDAAMNFAKTPDGWLLFLGETGCGKTHLAAAIVNYRYEAGHPALFVVVPEFLDHLRSTFSPDSKVSYDQLFESVKSAPLLVLDDFGEQSTTPWAKEKLYQVLNYRYNGRLPTIITTRYSLDEIVEKFDSPVSSRLADKNMNMVFNIIVPDYRLGVINNHKPRPRAARDRTQRSR